VHLSDLVDLGAAELRLKSTKGDLPVRVFLSEGIATHLRRWLGDRAAGPLFTDRHGRRLSPRHVRRRFKSWLRAGGITGPRSARSPWYATSDAVALGASRPASRPQPGKWARGRGALYFGVRWLGIAMGVLFVASVLVTNANTRVWYARP
jgi:hypothetical protein